MNSTQLGALFLRYREKGDMSAFQTILDSMQRPLFNYLLRLMQNRDDAEDILQDVWLKVIRQKSSYNEQGQFSSWLYRIAHNHCLDLFRKRNKYKEESEYHAQEGQSVLEHMAGHEPSPWDCLLEKEQGILLEQTVAQLPVLIREVFLLRAVHDVPFKEIAKIQDAPLGTVLSRMHQAVNRLKEWIHFEGDSARLAE